MKTQGYKWWSIVMLWLLATAVHGQNGIIGAGFTNGWADGINDVIGFDGGVQSSRIKILKARGTGSQYFRLVRNWSGDYTQFASLANQCTDYELSARAGENISLSPNHCYTGAFFVNVQNINDNYVFKTPNGHSALNLVYFRVQGDIHSVMSVERSLADVTNGANVSVTATLSGTLATGQAAYLRYTSDGWNTSTIVQMNGSGISRTATIPAATNITGKNISYYVFTSGEGLNISHADADFYTINYNTNDGANYNYTVIGCPSVTVSPASLVSATEGEFYSQTISQEGLATPVFSMSSGALPAGLSLSAAGVLSGTPTVNGTFNFTITATASSGGCAGSKVYDLEIAEAPCTTPSTPSISASGATSFTTGGSVTLTASAAESYLWNTGATTQSITVSAAGMYSVQAISGECTSEVSAPVTISITTLPVCSAPLVNVDFTRLGSNYCFLQWAATPNALNYRIFWKKSDATKYSNTIIFSATKLSHKIENLTVNTDYLAYVAVRCSETGAWINSSPVAFTTKNDLCVMPTVLADTIGKNTVALRWAASSGIASYSIQWKATTASTWLAATVEGTKTSFRLTNLVAGTAYSFRVRATCASNGDLTTFMTGSFTTATTVFCSVPVFSVTNKTFNTITISWPPNTSYSAYVVRWQLQGSTLWKTSPQIMTNNYVITDLSAALFYNVQLQARCSILGEWTDFSGTLNVQSGTSSSCATPPIDSLKASPTRTVSVFWAATANVSSFEISRRPVGGTWNAPNTVAGTATRYNMSSNLYSTTLGNHFEVRMRAKCADNGAWMGYETKLITLGGSERPSGSLGRERISQPK